MSANSMQNSIMEFKNQPKHYNLLGTTYLDKFRRQINCDVSLVIAGRMMKAHKHVLATYSTFFKEIFDELEANTPAAMYVGANVAFLNYKYEHVESLLKYMYTGSIKISKDDCNAILKCATDLGITAIIEFITQQALNNEASGDNFKRKLDDRGKENRSNAVEAKRSKSDAPKESVSVSDSKRKESKGNENEREATAEDILAGVSFDRKTDKTSNNTSVNANNTQIMKVTKPSKSSEPAKDQNAKPDQSSKSMAPKKDDRVNSFPSSQKLIPSATSTPKVNNNVNSGTTNRSKAVSDDSDDSDSMDYSPFQKKQDNFADKLKSMESLTSSKSDKKDKEDVRPDSTSRKEDNNSTAAKPKVEVEMVTCSTCSKKFAKGTHLKETELPTPPAMCPMQGCEKMMKMNRMLKDHLTKFHKVSICDEK